MLPIQIIFISFFLAALWFTWRRKAYAWSILWILASIIILLPQSTTVIAHAVGVGRGVDVVVYASIAILFVLIFRLYIAVERLERQLTEMVKRDALKQLP